MKTLKTPFILLAGWLTGLTSSTAAVVFSDNFTGVGLPADARYYGTAAANFSMTIENPGLTGETLQYASTGNGGVGSYAGPIKSFYADGSQITLGSVGDVLSLSFEVRATNDWQNTQADQFRFGLMRYTGTANNDNPVAIAANLVNTTHYVTAYFGAIGIGTTSSGIFEQDSTAPAGNTKPFNSGNNVVTELLDIPTTTIATFANTSDTTVYAISLTLTRVASGMEITIGKGVETATVLDTGSPYFSFNALGMMATHRTGTENNFWIDNVTLDFIPIPEPSTLAALAGCLALAVFGYGRRQR